MSTANIQRRDANVRSADTGGRAPRVAEIDTAKGIGIVLVVFGHMVARDLKPLGNDWWLVWHDHLYAFHMAFFFFLSGYVFFMQPPAQWSSRLRKSVAKLAPAYALFAMIVYLAKAVAVRLMHVDRPVRAPFDELVQMVSYPTEGFAQFLWFIFTLLMIYALMALLKDWVLRHFEVALGLALVFHLLSLAGYVTEFLAFHQLARYTLFFLVAAACHRHRRVWTTMIARFGVVFFAALVLALVLLPEPWLPTVAGLLSVPALVGLAVWLNRWEGARRMLEFLGRNTLTIYLMNSLAMGLVRAVVLRLWGWDGWHFFVVAPVLLAAGLLLPILLQRVLFARWAWADRITR